MAQHADEGVVAIQQVAGWCGDEYAFLHPFEQRPVLLLRCAALGDVADHVDGSALLRALIDVGGC